MIADRLRCGLACTLALVIPALLAPAAFAVPGELRPDIYAYDETGATLTSGLAGAIDEEGRAALEESGVVVVAYAVEHGDATALADDVARSWNLPADAVVIGVVRDPPALAVRPAGRLDAARAAGIGERTANEVAAGRLAQAALAAAHEARLAVRPPGVVAAERARLGLQNTILGAAVLLLFSIAAAVVLTARAGAGLELGARPPGLPAAVLGRLVDPDAPVGRLANAERLEFEAGGTPSPAPPSTARVARCLALLVALLGGSAAALALARDATGGAVAVLLGAGLLGALALLAAARAADRDDSALHARIYAEHLAQSADARAAAPVADLVALGLPLLPDLGDETSHIPG